MPIPRQPQGEVPPAFRGMTIGQILQECARQAESRGDQKALKNHEINCAVRGIETGEDRRGSIIVPHAPGMKIGGKTFREKWETEKPKGQELDL
jgi:hypothetical protein